MALVFGLLQMSADFFKRCCVGRRRRRCRRRRRRRRQRPRNAAEVRTPVDAKPTIFIEKGANNEPRARGGARTLEN